MENKNELQDINLDEILNEVHDLVGENVPEVEPDEELQKLLDLPELTVTPVVVRAPEITDDTVVIPELSDDTAVIPELSGDTTVIPALSDDTAVIPELSDDAAVIPADEAAAESVPAGNTILTHLPLFHEKKIGAWQWGMLVGKTQTNLNWNTMNGGTPDPDPALWQHDLLYADGTPYDQAETDLIAELTGKGK